MTRREGGGMRTRVAGRWALAAVVVGSAMALGGVHTATLVVVGLMLVVTLGLLTWQAEPLVHRRPAQILTAVGASLVIWTFLQQVPIPASLLAEVAPANADVWSRALTPLREEGPRWAGISLDPPATRVQVMRGIVILLAFACGLRIAARTDGVKFLERTVLASSTVVGLAALVHPLLGVEKVFGFWKPETAEFGTRLAPLLNTNHLSAYLNVGSCIALAWALARKTRVHRAVPLLLYAFLVAVQIWVASRAGVAAMLLGSLGVLWFVQRGGASLRPIPKASVAGALIVLVGVAGAVLALQDRAVDDLTNADTLKLTLVRRAAATVPPFLWVGMGRGSFESVFNAFRSDGEGHLVFTHAENVVIQWMAEWGAPVALVALAAIGFSLRPAVALARSSVPAGPAAALFAVSAHNLVDFNLEVPAVAVALAVCAACVTGGRADTQRSASASWPRSRRVAVPLVAVATMAWAVVILRGLPHELHAEQARLRDLALSPDTPREVFVAEVRSAMLRHPAEPYLPLMGGVRAARAHDESAIPWIGRALERATVYGRAHLLLARQLGRRYPAQARLEYRLAMEQDYNLIEVALNEGLQVCAQPDDLLQLVPNSRHAEVVLERMTQLVPDRIPGGRDKVLGELAARNPASPLVARASAQRALDALKGGDPACARDRNKCVAQARLAADDLKRLAPRACVSHQISASIRAESEGVARAYEELDLAIDGLDDRVACLELLVNLAIRLGEDVRISQALERLVQGSCVSDDDCVRGHLRAASVEETRKNHRRALAHAKKAHERARDRLDVLAVLARLAEAAGSSSDAIDAYQKLAARDPGNPAWVEAASRARAAQDASRRRALGIGD